MKRNYLVLAMPHPGFPPCAGVYGAIMIVINLIPLYFHLDSASGDPPQCAKCFSVTFTGSPGFFFFPLCLITFGVLAAFAFVLFFLKVALLHLQLLCQWPSAKSVSSPC